MVFVVVGCCAWRRVAGWWGEVFVFDFVDVICILSSVKRPEGERSQSENAEHHKNRKGEKRRSRDRVKRKWDTYYYPNPKAINIR